jgi:O-Antigen ligase
MFLGTCRSVPVPAFVAVCLLVAATPFETRDAILAGSYQRLTSTELVWLITATVWIGAHVWMRRWPQWRTPVTVPWLVWIAVMLIAAVVTDGPRANALKTVARLMALGGAAWMVATSVTSARRMAVLLGVAAATGTVVALIAVLEVWRVPAVLAGLSVFRDGIRLVGGEVRATSTLQYPTIAAMYLELVLCGALGTLLWIGERRGWTTAWIGLVGVATLVMGLALTLTRAAVLGALCGMVVAAWWRYRDRGLDRGVVLVAVCAVILACAPLVSASSEIARARWTTDGRQGWYRATFEAPPSLTASPGSLIEVPVTVGNVGRITWSSAAEPPFHLSYHWVDAESTRVVQFDGARTALPRDVAPGTRASVLMQVRVPRAVGEYRLAWDVVQEGRLWFGAEPGAQTTFTAVTVQGDPAAGLPVTPVPPSRAPAYLPVPVTVPGRLTLWRAALQMTADHPWLGVGPDNFRWRSGAYLTTASVDTRVHSNNLYLEVLTGGGVWAAAAFVWLLWRVVHVVGGLRHRLDGAALAAYSGVVAAGVAYLAHGCLDSFLTFTPTAFASAVVLGLVVAPCGWTEGA